MSNLILWQDGTMRVVWKTESGNHARGASPRWRYLFPSLMSTMSPVSPEPAILWGASHRDLHDIQQKASPSAKENEYAALGNTLGHGEKSRTDRWRRRADPSGLPGTF